MQGSMKDWHISPFKKILFFSKYMICMYIYAYSWKQNFRALEINRVKNLVPNAVS